MQRLPYAILLIWLKPILLVWLKATICNFTGLVKSYNMQFLLVWLKATICNFIGLVKEAMICHFTGLVKSYHMQFYLFGQRRPYASLLVWLKATISILLRLCHKIRALVCVDVVIIKAHIQVFNFTDNQRLQHGNIQ